MPRARGSAFTSTLRCQIVILPSPHLHVQIKPTQEWPWHRPVALERPPENGSSLREQTLRRGRSGKSFLAGRPAALGGLQRRPPRGQAP